MIIDFHTHIFPSFIRNDRAAFFSKESAFKTLYSSSGARLTGRKDLLQSMDEEGVHKSVIFGFPWQQSDLFKKHNDYILESVRQYPDRFIGFCCFDPLSKEAAGETERCLEAGCAGVGELAVYNQDFSSEVISGFNDTMAVSARFDVPVLIHTNEPVVHQYPGKQPMSLRNLFDFLKRYSSNRIVLAHWGGGIFFYSLMKKEVREVLNNVWFDTAASPFLYNKDVYTKAVEIIGAEKILFGSDYPLIKPSRYFNEMESTDLSSQSIEKITGANTAHLLRLG